jgi:hypothetical protein
MFKELKVIKLLILISLLTGIIFKMDFSDLAIQELYTDKLSYNQGDTVEIYSSSKSILPFNLEIDITDLSGKIISSFDLAVTKQKSPSKNILQYGLGYKKYTEFIISTDFKSGIYLIDNKYPLIVKSKEKSEITVVFPFMNNILYQPVNYTNVFSNNTPTANFNRTCEIDSYTKGMANFFSYLNTNYQVNYITDIEIENDNNYHLSDLIIIYGKSTCWTPKMKTGLEQYIGNGGGILTMVSYFANNICWKSQKNQITLVASSNIVSAWQQYNSTMPLSLTGASYFYSGYSDDKHYKIKDINHPIFNGINKSEIDIDAHLFSAPPIKWSNNSPSIKLGLMKYYDGEILAYSHANYKESQGSKGIFILQPDSNSGKILSLGAEDWCLSRNIGEKQQLQIITKNAVDYLIQQ